MIGLSVSFCVADIAAGGININDVDIIMGSTRCRTPKDWAEVVVRYKEVYWREFPEQAEQIFYTLLNSGKIEQTRLTCETVSPFVGNGHWAFSPEDIEWCD